jgi:hypothetical protein
METRLTKVGGQQDDQNRESIQLLLQWNVDSLRRNLYLYCELLFWICRLSLIVYLYMYHNWQSLIILVWICHSFYQGSVKQFSLITLYLYLPIFLIIFVTYYIVNIEYIIQPIDLVNDGKLGKYGIFKFQIPLLEVGF